MMATFRNAGPPVVVAWTVKIRGKHVAQSHTVSSGARITFDLEATNGQSIAAMCRNAGLVQES